MIPIPFPKTNQDRILRAEKLMSFDPSQRLSAGGGLLPLEGACTAPAAAGGVTPILPFVVVPPVPPPPPAAIVQLPAPVVLPQFALPLKSHPPCATLSPPVVQVITAPPFFTHVPELSPVDTVTVPSLHFTLVVA
jgi:hypothetical protein